MGADGFKRVTYRGFEALTVEALRDLRAEKDRAIEGLNQKLEEKEARIAALEQANAIGGDSLPPD